MPAMHVSFPEVEELRARTLALGPNAGASERGAILALLGSIERAELLIRRIDAERKSVNRAGILARVRAAAPAEGPEPAGGMQPVPAQ
jgi:phosphate:Na+ symporter